jgi:uncharacterized protein involved in exopolysaccharide biosynthesis
MNHIIASLLSPSHLSRFKQPIQVVIASALIAALVTLFVPNQYKSEARLLPADARVGGGSPLGAAAAAAVGVSIPGQESADATYVDILNSRRLREQLLQTRFRFHTRKWRFGSEQARDETLFEYLKKRNYDQAVNILKDKIILNRDLKTKLLTISFESESPELSQQVVECLVHQLDEFVVIKSQTRGGAKASFSQKRLEESRRDMVNAEAEFRSFLESNRNYATSSDPSIRLKGQRLENELKLRVQLVTTLTIGHEQALLEEKNDIPIINILDSANLPHEKSGPPRTMIVMGVAVLNLVVYYIVSGRIKIRI